MSTPKISPRFFLPKVCPKPEPPSICISISISWSPSTSSSSSLKSIIKPPFSFEPNPSLSDSPLPADLSPVVPLFPFALRLTRAGLGLFLVRTLRPVPFPAAAPAPAPELEVELESTVSNLGPGTEEVVARSTPVLVCCTGETEFRPLEIDERVRLAGDGVRWVDTSGDSIGGRETKQRRRLWVVRYSNMDQLSAHVRLMI
jgi:hypothetical protein